MSAISTNQQQLENICSKLLTPLRISAILPSGYPLICSLWYEYNNACFYSVTQENAKLVEILRSNPRCGFELSPNEPPYFGLRGYADAEIQSTGAAELLEKLIVKYLGNTNSSLARHLLEKSDSEVMIKLTPRNIFTWDYRERMSRE